MAPPGSNTLVLQDIAFNLKAGQGLGIIGPSASGKSTLVQETLYPRLMAAMCASSGRWRAPSRSPRGPPAAATTAAVSM